MVTQGEEPMATVGVGVMVMKQVMVTQGVGVMAIQGEAPMATVIAMART